MDRSEIERQELAGALRRVLPRDGRVEMQPGLTLFRVSTPTEPVYGVSESSFCVVAQGAKHVMLGEDRLARPEALVERASAIQTHSSILTENRT